MEKINFGIETDVSINSAGSEHLIAYVTWTNKDRVDEEKGHILATVISIKNEDGPYSHVLIEYNISDEDINELINYISNNILMVYGEGDIQVYKAENVGTFTYS